jgi:hypothetical protein
MPFWIRLHSEAVWFVIRDGDVHHTLALLYMYMYARLGRGYELNLFGKIHYKMHQRIIV